MELMREYWGTFKSDTRLFMGLSFSVSLSGFGQLNFLFLRFQLLTGVCRGYGTSVNKLKVSTTREVRNKSKVKFSNNSNRMAKGKIIRI